MGQSIDRVCELRHLARRRRLAVPQKARASAHRAGTGARAALLALVAVLAAVSIPAVAPRDAAAAQKLVVGMGNPDATFFGEALFTRLRLTKVRYVAAWDTALQPGWERTQADQFMAVARGRYDVLVSFARSYTPGRVGKAPSTATYRKAVAAFVKRYPQVRTYSPWDESNTCSEPTCRRPQLAAAYYRTLQRACRGCTVIAAEMLDTDYRQMRSYLQRFIRAAGKPTPRLWALHPYSDANRFRTIGTRTMLQTVPGTVWMTEVGGIYSFGSSFPPSAARQARATRWATRLAASSPRIARFYYYSFDGGGSFDSGLLSPSGAQRPAYGVFANWVAALRRPAAK